VELLKQPQAGIVVSDRVGRAVDDLDTTIREIRTVIFNLQPFEAYQSLRRRILETARAARTALGFEPSVQFMGAVDAAVSAEIAAHLLPTLQEALSNVARHAGATAVEVVVAVDHSVTLNITDDGVGLGSAALPGNGLADMAERARALGGVFTVSQSRDRPGTVLDWSVPTQLSG